MENEETVISDSAIRTLKTMPNKNSKDHVLITRIWRQPKFNVATISLSLSELEQISKKYNGGEKNGRGKD